MSEKKLFWQEEFHLIPKEYLRRALILKSDIMNAAAGKNKRKTNEQNETWLAKRKEK